MRACLLIILFPTFLLSQKSEGTITYVKTLNLQKKDNIRNSLNPYKSLYKLSFSDSISAYKEIHTNNGTSTKASLGEEIFFNFHLGKSIRLIDLAKKIPNHR